MTALEEWSQNPVKPQVRTVPQSGQRNKDIARQDEGKKKEGETKLLFIYTEREALRKDHMPRLIFP